MVAGTSSSLSLNKPSWVKKFHWIQTLAHFTIESQIFFIESLINIYFQILRKTVKFIFGSPKAHTWETEALKPRYVNDKIVIEPNTMGIVNMEKTMSQSSSNSNSSSNQSSYKFTEQDLITKTKIILNSNFGCKDNESQDLLASDFRFQAPIVGPLCKSDFIRIYGSFGLRDALPDLSENIFGFTIDPVERNRIWFFSRGTGTHDGDLVLGAGNIIKATGTKIEWPVQASSMSFDEEGKLYQLTVGYTCDKNIGNTGGMGALFGVLHAVGKGLPAPEAKPWGTRVSSNWKLLQYVGTIMEALGKGPGMDKK